MSFLARNQWNAKPPARPYKTFPDSKYVGIEVHHTVYPGSWDTARHARAIQAQHLGMGWTDVFYAFGGATNGDTVELRGWNRSQGTENTWDPDGTGDLPTGYLLPYVLFGNFHPSDSGYNGDVVTDEMVESFHEFRAELLHRNPAATAVRYHRMRKATACPGDLVEAEFHRFTTPPPENDDMKPAQLKLIVGRFDELDAKIQQLSTQIDDNNNAVNLELDSIEGQVAKIRQGQLNQWKKEAGRWRKWFPGSG